MALLALVLAAPSAQAFDYQHHCQPDPFGLCREVSDAVGLVIEVYHSPDGRVVEVHVAALNVGGFVRITLCGNAEDPWISRTGDCEVRAESDLLAPIHGHLPPGGHEVGWPFHVLP